MSDTTFIYAIEAPSFVAVVATPGYLPDSAEDAVEFDTAAEAWNWLAAERFSAEEEASQFCDDTVCDPTCQWRPEADATDTYAELLDMAEQNIVGTITGDTPGYHGDHDLGLSYSVDLAETA